MNTDSRQLLTSATNIELVQIQNMNMNTNKNTKTNIIQIQIHKQKRDERTADNFVADGTTIKVIHTNTNTNTNTNIEWARGQLPSRCNNPPFK